MVLTVSGRKIVCTLLWKKAYSPMVSRAAGHGIAAVSLGGRIRQGRLAVAAVEHAVNGLVVRVGAVNVNVCQRSAASKGTRADGADLAANREAADGLVELEGLLRNGSDG